MNKNLNGSRKSIKKSIWAIGGGKGGVGKSLTTICLGLWLTRLGKRVILLDADLGGANLHTFLGIKYPRHNLNDFLNRKVDTLNEVIVNTSIDGLKLISGASDLLYLANPQFAQKQKIFNHLSQLETDYILLDLGGGSSFNTLDFFLISDEKVVVLLSQLTSIQNAYGFIKNALFRKFARLFPRNSLPYSLIISTLQEKSEGKVKNTMGELLEAMGEIDPDAKEILKNTLEEFRPKLITNMIRDPKEKEAARMIETVSYKYLGIKTSNLGAIYYDSRIDKSVNQIIRSGTPDLYNESKVLQGSYEIVLQLMKEHK